MLQTLYVRLKVSYPVTNGEQADSSIVPQASFHQKGIYINKCKRQAPQTLQANNKNMVADALESSNIHVTNKTKNHEIIISTKRDNSFYETIL